MKKSDRNKNESDEGESVSEIHVASFYDYHLILHLLDYNCYSALLTGVTKLYFISGYNLYIIGNLLSQFYFPEYFHLK